MDSWALRPSTRASWAQFLHIPHLRYQANPTRHKKIMLNFFCGSRICQSLTIRVKGKKFTKVDIFRNLDVTKQYLSTRVTIKWLENSKQVLSKEATNVVVPNVQFQAATSKSEFVPLINTWEIP